MRARIAIGVVLIMSVLLGACGTAQDKGPASDMQPGLTAHPGLPSLPADKGAQSALVFSVQGSDAISTGGLTQSGEQSMFLMSVSGKMSWAMWRLSPGNATPLNLEVQLNSSSGAGAYLAVSDYDSGLWALYGPYLDTTSIHVDASNVSPSGGLFVAAIAYDTASAQIYSLNLTVDSPWTILTLDDEGHAGAYSSLAIVDGCPAIAYQSDAGLRYARAATPEGADLADWNLITIEEGSSTGLYCSLAVVDGNPAISYHDDENNDLKYARAATRSGSDPGDWSSIIIENGYPSSGNYMGVLTSLAVADQRPAISYAYKSGLGQSVKFAWSSTATGEDPADWANTTLWYEGDNEIYHTSVMEVEGRPAICLSSDFFGAVYGGITVYARCPAGSGLNYEDWPKFESFTTGGYDASMAIVDGTPALVSYREGDPAVFFYWNSYIITDIDNLYWQYGNFSPVLDGDNGGQDLSLALISNNDPLDPVQFPAVSHISRSGSNRNLMYTWSGTPRGEQKEDWSSQMVESGVCAQTCLACIDGKPAISYYDSFNGVLKYAIRLGD